MRAIRVSSTLRRGFAAAVSMAALVSCAQDTAPSQPDPPADVPTALVYGMAASPIYEALKSRVRMTVTREDLAAGGEDPKDQRRTAQAPDTLRHRTKWQNPQIA